MMSEIKQTPSVVRILNKAFEYSEQYRHEFVMPEHLLYALLGDFNFRSALNIFYDWKSFEERITICLEKMESVPVGIDYTPEASEQMGIVLELAIENVALSNAESLDVPHLVNGILNLENSWAAYLLKDCLANKTAIFLRRLIDFHEAEPLFSAGTENSPEEYFPEEISSWRELVTCMNDSCQQRNPLIGRENELQRTIQVLCRRDKNNPLHVGEPGVGKTALVWGLACRIEAGQVPERLQGSRIYQLDMGSLLAGTQYRGDLEKRIQIIMEGIMSESDHNIVYIDEIHTLVGAGAVGDSAMDASNMLKSYFESDHIRFIGSTTFEEFSKYFSRSKGMIRRFQQIDILEPSVEETKHILQQLRASYETYHGVTYDDEAISFAVESSAKHITDRFLPDKALDLIDEAGAAMEIDGNRGVVGKKEIAAVLAKVCKVTALSEAEEDDFQKLEKLSSRMLSKIYGQDEAIRQVVESVQMSRAGLLDDQKPLASLLFVGPTGVGKTEVAKTLSHELGIELVRFDMSEYTEKHAVAKLIGSPAGYVGYEEGGLLTDAIRKSPNCVLLLDEIEKAHQDIYNVLLQVMDYAQLTDNKGRHADFRNVILIMTSNAGAQFAAQAKIGFASTISRGDAMMKQVKKIFKPEFLNRLSGTIVFREMDRMMARLILEKKLRELDIKLAVKKVKMTLSQAAFEHLLNDGFTVEYGAREMDRVISQQLKPLLMREILFGKLKNGGEIAIDDKNGNLFIE